MKILNAKELLALCIERACLPENGVDVHLVELDDVWNIVAVGPGTIHIVDIFLKEKAAVTAYEKLMSEATLSDKQIDIISTRMQKYL